MKNKRLLLVEDNDADIFLVEESLKSVDELFRPQLITLKDGEEAIRLLSGQIPTVEEYIPEVIMLDINLPKHSGIEVLKFIRKDPKLRQIPVVMMSTSQTKNDISTCFDNGCNSYIIKPIDFNDFSHLIYCFCHYWFKTSALPSF
jgi:CheY-like chemotaxis protein